MTEYSFSAIAVTGGSVEADSLDDALEKLRKEGFDTGEFTLTEINVDHGSERATWEL